MCRKEFYNEILESNNYKTISLFMDSFCECENNLCPFLKGGCDYKGMLDDKLVELEMEELDKEPEIDKRV